MCSKVSLNLHTFEWHSVFPTYTGRLPVLLTTLFYYGETRVIKRSSIWMQRQLSGQQINCGPKERKRTCILDIATFPAHSSVVDMIPNQNTGTKETIMSLNRYFKNFCFAYDIFHNVHLTWTCLQSCPLAGSCIRRKVIGHLRETLMAVCSTPSSPLSVAFPVDAATLLKFLLTLKRKEGGNMFKAKSQLIHFACLKTKQVVKCPFLSLWLNLGLASKILMGKS